MAKLILFNRFIIKENKMKETYYIKDKYDGQEYCISGEKHFFLINANESIKQLIQEKLFAQCQKIIKMIEKDGTEIAQGELPHGIYGTLIDLKKLKAKLKEND